MPLYRAVTLNPTQLSGAEPFLSTSSIVNLESPLDLIKNTLDLKNYVQLALTQLNSQPHLNQTAAKKTLHAIRDEDLRLQTPEDLQISLTLFSDLNVSLTELDRELEQFTENISLEIRASADGVKRECESELVISQQRLNQATSALPSHQIDQFAAFEALERAKIELQFRQTYPKFFHNILNNINLGYGIEGQENYAPFHVMILLKTYIEIFQKLAQNSLQSMDRNEEPRLNPNNFMTLMTQVQINLVHLLDSKLKSLFEQVIFKIRERRVNDPQNRNSYLTLTPDNIDRFSQSAHEEIRIFMDHFSLADNLNINDNIFITQQVDRIDFSTDSELARTTLVCSEELLQYAKKIAPEAAVHAKQIVGLYNKFNSSLNTIELDKYYRNLRASREHGVKLRKTKNDLIRRINEINEWRQSGPELLYYSFDTLSAHIPHLINQLAPLLPFNFNGNAIEVNRMSSLYPSTQIVQSKLQHDIQKYEFKWREINKIENIDEKFYRAIQNLQTNILKFYTQLSNLKIIKIFSMSGMPRLGEDATEATNLLIVEAEKNSREEITSVETAYFDIIKKLETDAKKTIKEAATTTYIGSVGSVMGSALWGASSVVTSTLSYVPGVPTVSSAVGASLGAMYGYMPSMPALPSIPYYSSGAKPVTSTDADYPPSSPTTITPINFPGGFVPNEFVSFDANLCSIHLPQFGGRCCSNAGHKGSQPSAAAAIPCPCTCHK